MKFTASWGRRLILAVVGGFLFATATAAFLRRQETKVLERYALAPVLRAKKYIAVGKSVTADMIEEVPMPRAYLPPGAFQKKSELFDAKGNIRYKTRIGVLKGDVISVSKLSDLSSLVGLAWLLQPGQTALSLKLTASAAVAGLLQPGDWVSVISLIGDQSTLFLPRVRVAAVGDQVWDPAGAAQNEVSKSVAGDGFLVTLVLNPREALMASLAAEKGNLVLLLASPMETDPPARGLMTLKRFAKEGK